MKKVFVGIISIFSLLISEAQSVKDTTFLLIRSEDSRSVFIDTNRSSAFYAGISDFNFRKGTNDSANFAEAITNYSAEKPLIKNQRQGLPANWCRLYLYKNDYYVYGYADYTTSSRIQINDSVVLAFGEDLRTVRLNSIEKLNKNTYRIVTNELGKRSDSILIHMVDPRGIAVFEFPEPEEKYRYLLMVNTESLKLFPMIVDRSRMAKEMEVEGFDRPDYKKLIGQ
jgi:hypothetical protein